jgi:hypothetical protein
MNTRASSSSSYRDLTDAAWAMVGRIFAWISRHRRLARALARQAGTAAAFFPPCHDPPHAALADIAAQRLL